jgi:hypothetical protein
MTDLILLAILAVLFPPILIVYLIIGIFMLWLSLR